MFVRAGGHAGPPLLRGVAAAAHATRSVGLGSNVRGRKLKLRSYFGADAVA